MLILIKGAGDLATGVAHRLYRSRFQVVMTELDQPTAVRRTVAFSQCMYDGTATVEGVTARRVDSPREVSAVLDRGEIPVICDPTGMIRSWMSFDALVDAILAKHNTGTAITDAPVVLALGPGFTAGVDCHGVIETMRGHDMGRLILSGSALPNTGVPGQVGGYSRERIIRAPSGGVFEPLRAIGDRVRVGTPLARVGDRTVLSSIDGIVRGMLPAGLPVKAGMKAGDVDPRCEPQHCYTISDKARAVGGGVLEGLLCLRPDSSPRKGGKRRC